jgi:hypothetical protein
MCAVLAMVLTAGPALAAEAATESLPAGLEGAIDRGLSFIQKRQKSDGSFDSAGPPRAVTGLAVLAFLSAGHTPEMGKYGLTLRRAVDHLVRQSADDDPFGASAGKLLVDKNMMEDVDDWYAAQYLATLAAFQSGGTAWPAMWKRGSEQLLPLQNREDGSWPARKNPLVGDGRGARVYSTAMAVMTLSLPLRILPVHQPPPSL